MAPNLDHWLPDPALRVAHRRKSGASTEALWEAARTVRVCDTALLGRLVRWRIPGTTPQRRFDELFANPPFTVLERGEMALVSGIVGRIWTLRRDYPRLDEPEDFRQWSKSGTARVLFANWASASGLHSEVRVQPFGPQGRIGLAAVRPLISAFHNLIGSDGLEAAVRLAEGRPRP